MKLTNADNGQPKVTDPLLVLYSVPSVAKKLDCSERFVWDEIYKGRLAKTTIGRLVKISEAEIRRYIASNTQKPFDANDFAKSILKPKH